MNDFEKTGHSQRNERVAFGTLHFMQMLTLVRRKCFMRIVGIHEIISCTNYGTLKKLAAF